MDTNSGPIPRTEEGGADPSAGGTNRPSACRRASGRIIINLDGEF